MRILSPLWLLSTSISYQCSIYHEQYFNAKHEAFFSAVRGVHPPMPPPAPCAHSLACARARASLLVNPSSARSRRAGWHRWVPGARLERQVHPESFGMIRVRAPLLAFGYGVYHQHCYSLIAFHFCEDKAVLSLF